MKNTLSNLNIFLVACISMVACGGQEWLGKRSAGQGEAAYSGYADYDGEAEETSGAQAAPSFMHLPRDNLERHYHRREHRLVIVSSITKKTRSNIPATMRWPRFL